MANENAKRILEAISKYGLQCQVTYGKNPKQITSILVKGQKISTSSWSGQDIDNKIKALACGETLENNVSFKGDSVYLNGNRYNILDIVKDIEYNRLIELLAENKEKHADAVQAIQDWLKNNLWLYLFEQKKSMGDETAEELQEDWMALVGA